MGLDISAYRGLAQLDALFDEDGEPVNPETREHYENYLWACDNTDFPGRISGLVDRGIYSYVDRQGLCAGSYSGYGRWRDQLAEMAGYEKTVAEVFMGSRTCHSAGAWAATSGPFWELILFSDCEGTIGPVVSAKLAKDFADWDDRAKEFAPDEYFYNLYVNWRSAFEMAADGGAVDFH